MMQKDFIHDRGNTGKNLLQLWIVFGLLNTSKVYISL